MNYIGSKNKLSSFILENVISVLGADLSNKVFCDLFAGTGAVGRVFKPLVKQVISNDIELYSYILNKNYIGNYQDMDYAEFIDELNHLVGTEGFIFQEYSENGQAQRLYFSAENGKKIDAIRQTIAHWQQTKRISTAQYYFLLCSLLESADKVANTASVYGAFLKKLKRTAQQKIKIEPAVFTKTQLPHEVYQQDANLLIGQIKGDILYLDPPYNARQYGANYHLLNTIAQYQPFEPKGKTGLRAYLKSSYCSRASVALAFEDLIKQANFRYIFLSYNNEGLMSFEQIQEIMQKYGHYSSISTEYQRFKADKTENRQHKANSTREYLHILEKD